MAAAAGTAGAAATGAEVVRRLGLRGLAAVALATAAALGAAPVAGPNVDVKVSRRGFEPSRIALRRGETTRLTLTSEDGEHCFAIDALRIEKRVASGRPTKLELTPERAGTLAFYCCLETGKQAELERGELVVSE
jgi:heme/copper-type cytochrome/quinol oxidase subunit 2